MARAFSSGPASDTTKEVIHGYSNTYKFSFGWFPNDYSKAGKCEYMLQHMLNYFMDDPARGCREASVNNTIFGSGKMDTVCGTVKWAINLANPVDVPAFVPPPATQQEAERWCFDPREWAGHGPVSAEAVMQ